METIIMIKRFIATCPFLLLFSITVTSFDRVEAAIDIEEINSSLHFDDLNFIEKETTDTISSEIPVTRDASAILNNIVNFAKLDDTDLTKLYISTAPVRSRHASYLPYALPQHKSKITFDFLIHFQMHSEMVYPFKERINFDFISPIGLETIHDLLDLKVPGSSLLFDEGIDLFQQMTIQERRGIFATFFEIPFYNFFFRTEFFLVGIERNHWIDQKLQEKGLQFFKKIETVVKAFTTGIDDKGSLSTTEIKKKFEDISYKFGFGDPRLQLGYSMINTKHLQTALGIQCIPPLSALTEKSIKIPENEDLSLLGEIERINRISKKPILGSNGHWGLGGFFEVKVPLSGAPIDIFAKISFDRILAKEMVRDVPIDGEVFPRLLIIESEPGNITHLLCGAHGHYREWHVGLGYDFYKQEKETLCFACNTEGKENANLSRASQPECFHHSLFSSIDYRWSKENAESISCGLSGSVSFKEKGIGPHWHVGLKIRLLL